MKHNISYEESLEILNSLDIPPFGYENVFLSNSLNRVLAQDIVAQENMPAYPTSAMDGYAFSSSDLKHYLSNGLKIAGINKAGESNIPKCSQGECVKTFTGAIMPEGCDSLILVENAIEDNGILKPKDDTPIPNPNQWIRKIGENYSKGELLLRRGSKISPFEIGLLAELNYVFVPVFIRPKIAILSGGDEIVEIGEEGRANAIRSVNNHLLKAIAQMWGAQVSLFPLLKDNKEEIRAQVLNALKNCNILITTGGASKGDYDFVQEVLQEECCMCFKGVKMKPGKPVGFGIYQSNVYVFGLPGFPNSCAVTFMLFVRHIFSKMLCMPHQTPPKLKAKLLEDIQRADSRAEFRICDVQINNGQYEVGFWSKKAFQSSVINNFCNSSALILLEENGGKIRAGEDVEIFLLEHLINI